jgi:hypothetical protein
VNYGIRPDRGASTSTKRPEPLLFQTFFLPKQKSSNTPRHGGLSDGEEKLKLLDPIREKEKKEKS